MNERAKPAGDQPPWTVLRLLNWTTDYFRSRGSDSARLDAEILLAHALKCSRIELYTAYESQPDESHRQTFRQLVRRRGQGVPVAYLVGYREFYALRLQVTPAVLIPRPETEHLVILALDHAKSLLPPRPPAEHTPSDSIIAKPATEEPAGDDQHGEPTLAASAGPAGSAAPSERPDRPAPLRIADVGTGSGAIAIAVAKHLRSAYPPGGMMVATDISTEALTLARKNAAAHEVTEQIEFFQGDLLSPLPPEPTLDLILSNPPYVSQAEYDALDPSVREHEPAAALLAGPQGTEVIRRLVDQAAPRLRPGGSLMVEISPMIAEATAAIVSEHGEFTPPTFTKDLAGHRRVISATRR